MCKLHWLLTSVVEMPSFLNTMLLLYSTTKYTVLHAIITTSSHADAFGLEVAYALTLYFSVTQHTCRAVIIPTATAMTTTPTMHATTISGVKSSKERGRSI